MNPKNYEQLEKIVTDYFSDNCRSTTQTKEDLLGIVEHIECLIEALDGDE